MKPRVPELVYGRDRCFFGKDGYQFGSRSARAYFSLKISRLRVESRLVAGGPAQHGTPPGFYISARGIPAGLQVDVAA